MWLGWLSLLCQGQLPPTCALPFYFVCGDHRGPDAFMCPQVSVGSWLADGNASDLFLGRGNCQLSSLMFSVPLFCCVVLVNPQSLNVSI